MFSAFYVTNSSFQILCFPVSKCIICSLQEHVLLKLGLPNFLLILHQKEKKSQMSLISKIFSSGSVIPMRAICELNGIYKLIGIYRDLFATMFDRPATRQLIFKRLCPLYECTANFISHISVSNPLNASAALIQKPVN